MKFLKFSVLVFCGLSVVIGQDYSGSCDEQQAALFSTEDGSRPPCDEAREKIQRILYGCTVDDSVIFVKDSLISATAYAKGADCHNTTGVYPECHLVPKCYSITRKVGADGEYEFNCGEHNKNVEDFLECVQRQIDEGCEIIGEKVKKMHADAAKVLCAKDPASSALSCHCHSLWSVLVTMAAWLLTTL